MAEEAVVEKGSSSGGAMKFMLMGMGVALVLAAAGIGFWAGGAFGSQLPEAANETEAVEPEAAPEITEVVNLDPIVVNLLPGGTAIYARIGISLGVSGPPAAAGGEGGAGASSINKDRIVPMLKDKLLSSVGQLSGEQLLQPGAKDQLKQQIIEFVNGVIPPNPEGKTPKVVEVYFTDFLVQ